MDQKTMWMEMECARDCRKVDIRVHIRVKSPLSYNWRVDSYIFLLFSYSIRFILVDSCEILGRTKYCSYYFRTFNCAQLKKKNILYIWPFDKEEWGRISNFLHSPRLAVDSAQWHWGIMTNVFTHYILLLPIML